MQTTIKYPRKELQEHFPVIAGVLYLLSYLLFKQVWTIAATRLIAFYLIYRFTLRFFVEVHVPRLWYINVGKLNFLEFFKKTFNNLLLFSMMVFYITASILTLYGFDPYITIKDPRWIQILFTGVLAGAASLLSIILNRALTINAIRKGNKSPEIMV